MFCLCVYKIIIKVTNKQDVNSKLLSKKENTKIIKADTIEDKEEYFVTKDIIIQEIQNIKLRFKDKTKIIPI